MWKFSILSREEQMLVYVSVDNGNLNRHDRHVSLGDHYAGVSLIMRRY